MNFSLAWQIARFAYQQQAQKKHGKQMQAHLLLQFDQELRWQEIIRVSRAFVSARLRCPTNRDTDTSLRSRGQTWTMDVPGRSQPPWHALPHAALRDHTQVCFETMQSGIRSSIRAVCALFAALHLVVAEMQWLCRNCTRDHDQVQNPFIQQQRRRRFHAWRGLSDQPQYQTLEDHTKDHMYRKCYQQHPSLISELAEFRRRTSKRFQIDVHPKGADHVSMRHSHRDRPVYHLRGGRVAAQAAM